MTRLIQAFTSRDSFKSLAVTRSGTIPSGAVYSHFLVLTCLLLGLFVTSAPVHALEKYGRPLPSMEEEQGETAREAEETLFNGYLLTSAFVSNPTFAVLITAASRACVI